MILVHNATVCFTKMSIQSQPSDSLANDGGMYNTNNNNDPAAGEDFDNQNIMFAPADPTDSIKKRKKEKKNRSKDSSKQSPSSATSSNGKRLSKSSSLSTNNTRHSGSSSRRTVHHKNATPPRVPRSKSMNSAKFDDADVCYAEWWMSCFPDAFK